MKWGLFCLFERFNTHAKDAIENQLKLIELADAMRFDEVWVGEHHFNDFSICPTPTLLLAHALSKTKNVRLGCAGFLAPFYDAIRLAEEVAVLDILSHGRMNLGFAKGAFAPDSKHFNVTVEQLRPMMFECADAITQLLHTKDRPVSFEGQFIHFSEVDIEPKALQEKIPTYIATFSSDETIDFAAQRGFGLMLSQGVSLEECERVSDRYESVAGFKPQIILLRTFYVAQSNEIAYAKARPAIDHFAKSMRAASSFNKSPHFDKHKYKKLIAERDHFFDGQKFFECGIIGDAKACIEKIMEIETRLSNVSITLKPLGVDLFENIALLRLFNETVRPYCKTTKELKCKK
ncbi:MAG: LLM class flavin-dependent oxidoreductase [Sulfurospirillaceae bacterium]|nr:LLM class flavin-dependent oxidoreductase [Sulfurospirillaceae bacterium]